MVYRYESDEDAFLEYPQPGADLPLFQPTPPRPPAPPRPASRSPSLPRVSQPAPPAADPVPIRPPSRCPPDVRRRSRTTGPPLRRRPGQPAVAGAGRSWSAAPPSWCCSPSAGWPSPPCSTTAPRPTTRSANGQAAPTPSSTAAPDGPPADPGLPGHRPAGADRQGGLPRQEAGGHRRPARVPGAQDPVRRQLRGRGHRRDRRPAGPPRVQPGGPGHPALPDDDHLLTAGLFNLTDVATAQRVRDRIRQLLDDRQGRFRGMPAGDDTEAVANAAARVGWQVRGHYIAYCLVDPGRRGPSRPTTRPSARSCTT